MLSDTLVKMSMSSFREVLALDSWRTAVDRSDNRDTDIPGEATVAGEPGRSENDVSLHSRLHQLSETPQ